MIRLVGVVWLMNIFFVPNSDGQVLVDQLRSDFLNLEDKLWKYALEEAENGFNDTDDPGLTIIRDFAAYDVDLQKIPQDILYGMEIIRQAPPFLFLYSDLRVVSDMYEKFRQFLITSTSMDSNNLTVLDEHETKMSYIIGEVMHDPKNNMNKTLTNIFDQTFLYKEEGYVMGSLLDMILRSDYICKNFKQSPQQVFYNLYNAVSLVHLKAYVMVQFSYLAQRLGDRGNYTQKSLIARKQFEQMASDVALHLQVAMKITSGDLRRCDPTHHVKGATYEELLALIQGHIENEADMNYKGTCRENCAAYPVTKSYGCYDSQSEYCRRRKSCKGKLIGCKFVESHMTACFSPSSSSRRYQYIKYKSGRVLGEESWCQSKNINSWFRWFVHCSYCLCLCDQEGIHSDRYFNTRPVLADVANNRVVTGLRIVKHNRLIHLQIQEGRLLPYGYIDNSTVRWVPVDDYKITDEGVTDGVDFHTMRYESRTLFLDDLMPHETDHIITGVRFEYTNDHLKFMVNVRAFDFEKGTLSNNSYYIFGGQDSSRHKIHLEDADVPTNSPPSEPDLETDTYVEFTHTSFDKDAAQTTVPFFDAQPVASRPAVPLRRAGIYYKGRPGYGGFVAPKITTYDFGQHVRADFPGIPPREDSQDEFPIVA